MKDLIQNITEELYEHLFEKDTFTNLSKEGRLLLLQSYLLKVFNLNKNNYFIIDREFPLKHMKNTK